MGRTRWITVAVLMCLSNGAGAQAPMPALDEALDAPTRAHVVNEYARRLTAQHVDPGRAKAVADNLRQRLNNGEYNDQTTARLLAARVSRDVAAMYADRQTYLEYVPYDLGDERQRPPPPVQSADNFGLRKFETLGDNIGYLHISRFAPVDRASANAAARFMSQAGDCAALIIDLRDAGGDSEAMAALLSSYLLVDRRSYIFKDKQIHLHDQVDREGKVMAEYWTTADAPGKHFGGYKPLYLLVNERTSSAAEAFAYDLQQYYQRAVIVGMPTMGDARVAAKQRVSRQLQTVIAATQAVNLSTRGNWEGTGVQPNRVVTAADALNAAIAMAQASLKPKR
ncbi:Peptidase family S41 [Duganella sacchari]|uniref:Peptidase family S41 n=1 Tax=Duganella sacchari TaxID=551987 RepID=A0A1M7HT81_9BURK|nr:S41 family peptidase [Duganella sacchari]SHM31543.1 Peptidase family S41 [Duganella sacchari]